MTYLDIAASFFLTFGAVSLILSAFAIRALWIEIRDELKLQRRIGIR